MKVFVNEPKLDGNEKKYLSECIDSGWISFEGSFVRKFEQGMAKLTGRKYAISTSSGSAALETAVMALRLGPGDEVILPTFTIISCILPILRCGAKPVLVDADPQTWNMDVSMLEKKISKRTKAIIAVHLYGLPVDMNPVMQLAKKYHLYVIEDAAEMHGQTYHGKPCGSFGDISVFSFYPNKHITCGEGGMVLTDDAQIAERSRQAINLFFGPRRYVHEDMGYNFRMTNLQAAVGCAQLERIGETVRKKRHLGRRYQELLRDIDGLQLPVPVMPYAENIYWVFGLVLDDSLPLDADGIIGKLSEEGIGARNFFWCMHEQPVFSRRQMFQGETYPCAERLARRGFYLPSGLTLTDDEQLYVADRLKKILLRL